MPVKKSSGRKKSTSKSGSKAVTLSTPVFDAIKKLQEELEAKLGGKMTYAMVIQALLQDRIDLENVRKEIKEIQEEADKTQDLIKDLLKTAISNKPVFTLTQSMPYPNMMPGMQLNAPPQGPPSPFLSSPYPVPGAAPMAPAPPEPPKPIKAFAPMSANVKKDYQAEIKSIFNGDVLKPSDILKATNPKHANSEIKEIDAEKVPDIEQVSHAEKNKDKFKTEHYDFKPIFHAPTEEGPESQQAAEPTQATKGATTPPPPPPSANNSDKSTDQAASTKKVDPVAVPPSNGDANGV